MFKVRKHYEFLFTRPFRNLVVVGARNSGKTWSAILWLYKTILLAKENRNVETMFYGQTLATVKTVLTPLVTQIGNLLNSKRPGMHEFNFSTGDIRINYGQKDVRRCYVSSYERKDRARGIHPRTLIMDEPAQCPRGLYYDVIHPMVKRPSEGGQILMIGTPGDREGILFREIIDKGIAGNNNLNETIKINNLDKSSTEDELWLYRLIQAPDCMSASDWEYLQSVYKDDPESLAREHLGDHRIRGRRSGFCFYEELAEFPDHVSVDITYDPTRELYAAWDLGHYDDTAVWIFQIKGESVYFLDYYEGNNMQAETHLAKLKERWQNITTHYMPRDSLNKGLVSRLTVAAAFRQLQERVIPLTHEVIGTIKLSTDIPATARMIRRAYFNSIECRLGLEHLKNYELTAIINPNDPYNPTYVNKPTAASEAHTHAADALRYAYYATLLLGMWSNKDFRKPVVKIPTKERSRRLVMI